MKGKAVFGSILAVGDELVSGRVQNTTSYWASDRLFRTGYLVKEIVTVGDRVEEIAFHIKRLLELGEFLLVSGGLGPTEDDLTNEAVSKALGRPLVLFPEILERIRENEKEQGLSRSKLRERMAYLPEGAVPLSPDLSVAGYMLELGEKTLFCLPGVPSQFYSLFESRVLPFLLKKHPSGLEICSKRLKFFDLREAELNQAARKLTEEGIVFGFYPVFPEVHITITALEEDQRRAEEKVAKVSEALKREFPKHFFGEDQQEMASVVGGLLLERGFTLSVAESCTGGLLSSLITKIPGSSQYFLGGVVSYSNEAKTRFLGVPERLIRLFGAVSQEVAVRMAEGCRQEFGSDFSLAITGIAGPTGGTKEKPVGTVWIALSFGKETRALRFLFPGTRTEVQLLSAYTALDWLRRFLLFGEELPRYRFLRDPVELPLKACEGPSACKFR